MVDCHVAALLEVKVAKGFTSLLRGEGGEDMSRSPHQEFARQGWHSNVCVLPPFPYPPDSTWGQLPVLLVVCAVTGSSWCGRIQPYWDVDW